MPPKPLPRECRVCGTADKRKLVKRKSHSTGLDRICRDCSNDSTQLRNRKRSAYALAKERERHQRWIAANKEHYADTQRAYNRLRRKRRPSPAHVEIGQAVRAWRDQQQLSQADLAALLGCSQSAVSGRECGQWGWPAADLAKLQRAGVVMPGGAK